MDEPLETDPLTILIMDALKTDLQLVGDNPERQEALREFTKQITGQIYHNLEVLIWETRAEVILEISGVEDYNASSLPPALQELVKGFWEKAEVAYDKVRDYRNNASKAYRNMVGASPRQLPED